MKKQLFLLTLASFAICAFATVNFPYPQEKSYAHGTYVSGISDQVKSNFETFLTRFYEESGDLARIKFDDNSYTVSEGIGYGMIMMVYFSNNTTSYQSHFDKLWNYYNKWLNSNGLMHWKIQGFSNVAEQNAATDAEFDVAFALAMAYYQFGDEKYKTAASNLIAKIRTYEMNSNGLHKLGDMWDPYKNPSYVSPAAFEIFKSFDDASFWSTAISANYTLLKSNQNSNTGLPSGWSDASGNPVNGNAGYTAYDYDAPRAPWRWAWSYAWYGHSDAATLLSKLAPWVSNRGSASKLKVPMNLNDGSDYGEAWSNSTAVGPLTCAMLYSSTYDSKLKSYASTLLKKSGETYFNTALQVLSGLLLSGNMQNLAAMNSGASSSSTTRSSSSKVYSSSSSQRVSSSSSYFSSSSVMPSSSSFQVSSSSVPASSSSFGFSSSSVSPSSSSSFSSSSSVLAKSDWESEKANLTYAKDDGVTIGATSDWTSERVVTKNLGTVSAGTSYTLSFDAFVQAGGGSMDIKTTLNSYCSENLSVAAGESKTYTCQFTASATESAVLTLSMPGSRWEQVTISNLSLKSASDETTAISATQKTKSLFVSFTGKTLEIQGAFPANVEVFDMQGRVLKKFSQVTGQVSLEAIPAGARIIKIRAGSESLVKRISIR